jgi:threonine synthase
MAGDAAQEQPLDAQLVAQPKDEADIGQTAYIVQAQHELARLSGVWAAPEAAATWAAAGALRSNGFLSGAERVVLFCTGMGLKYPAPAAP